MTARLQAIRSEQALRAVRSGDLSALAHAMSRAPDAATAQSYLREMEPARTLLLQPPGVGVWGAADWQRRVLADESPRVIIRGGNKTGKTTALSLSLAAYFDGHHPVWKLPEGRPARVLYVAADLQNAYADDVCSSLREFLPPDRWGARCIHDPVRGFIVSGRRAFIHRDGHRILFRSGMQDGQAIAGVWADVVVVNEPPLQQRWGEIVRAAALVAGAPMLVGFTPVDDHGRSRDLAWFRDDVVERGSWSEHVITLTPANAPHRRPEDVERQIADMLPWEVAQRRDAAWEGPAPERTFSAFGPENTFDATYGDWAALPESPGEGLLRLKLAADHGEKANKEVVILYATHTQTTVAHGRRDDDVRCWVLDCYVSPGETSIAQDVEGVVQMLARWKLTPDHLDGAVGDTNSSGKGDWTSSTVNEAFSNGFRGLGYSLRMVAANKGAGSVGLGVRVINDACARGRFWVASTAAPIRRGLERWSGRNDSLKDLVDPVRYGPGAEYTAIHDARRARLKVAPAVAPTPWFSGGDWNGSF